MKESLIPPRQSTAGLALSFDAEALKYLETIPKKQRQQIISRIDALSKNPHPSSSKPLQGMKVGKERVFRERSGDYRILYTVRDDDTILVLDIGHRKDVYR